MKPIRSKEHLAFIRSLPCCVSGRTFKVEAAHIGRRGMGQKCSDFETIPLNATFHREQHRIGLKTFTRIYQLDIPELLTMFTAKPRLRIWDGRYLAEWRGHTICLTLVDLGFTSALICLRSRIQEILTDELQTRVRAFRSR